MLSTCAWITLGLGVLAFIGLVITGKSARQNVEVYAQKPFLGRAFKFIFMIAMFVAIYFPQWFHLKKPASAPGTIAQAVGVALCAGGLLLLVGARRTLGKNWSDLVVLKKDHEVVQNGPYRWMRHPLYTGMFLALIGSAVVTETAAAYWVVGASVVGLFMKAQKEETLLSKQLSGYAEYRRRVKGFVPFVF